VCSSDLKAQANNENFVWDKPEPPQPKYFDDWDDEFEDDDFDAEEDGFDPDAEAEPESDFSDEDVTMSEDVDEDAAGEPSEESSEESSEAVSEEKK